jgi:hypothetical protein
MIEQIPDQREIIKEEIRLLRQFAQRHNDWRHYFREPGEFKWDRFFRDELNGLADDMERKFFGIDVE